MKDKRIPCKVFWRECSRVCAICPQKKDEFGEGVVSTYQIEGVLAEQSIFHAYLGSGAFAFGWGCGICFAHEVPIGQVLKSQLLSPEVL